MKNKGLRHKPYRKLMSRLFFRTFIMMVVSIVIVLILRNSVQGKLGNYITKKICEWKLCGWEEGLYLYNSYVRRYMSYIIMAFIFVVFMIMFLIQLIWFTKYFDEMIYGVDQLAEGTNLKISMSSGLEFMEDKLNQVQWELARREYARSEAEERKNELVVYLAHDIKTPLTSVIGYISLLDENPDLTTEQRAKYTHITLEKAYRLEKLINEFFEIARYNLESVPINKEHISLSYMILQISDEAYPLLTSSNKSIRLHVEDELMIYADSEKIARVFNNLIKNAIAYGDEGCVIDIYAHVSAREAGALPTPKNGAVFYPDPKLMIPGVEICFENAGFIPREKLERIFEKFFRADPSRQTGTGGSGLGLAIAKDIIKLHGGLIDAYCLPVNEENIAAGWIHDAEETEAPIVGELSSEAMKTPESKIVFRIFMINT